MTTSLHDWLPAEQGPWHLDFEQWPQAQAQRWRAVLAVGAGGRRLLLAERDEDALLLQSVETRLDAPVGYLASLKAHLGASYEAFISDPAVEQVHFIGKDIVTFHTLFWPAMLHFSGRKVPSTSSCTAT